jgi:hypothetical protein
MTANPLVLAFGWTHPAMLGWMAAAAAPAVIHLLNRRHYRRQSWAAMPLLVEAVREGRRRLRFEQFLLVLVRTLTIVLVVLAVADPYVESGGLVVAPGGARTHRVFVLDASYSMAYTPADRSRFDQAKEIAAKIVRASPQGDGFSLVLMGDPPRVVVGAAAIAPAEFLRELESATISNAAVDLAVTLVKVEEVLHDARRQRQGLVEQEVYFLTDLCRVGWTPRPSSGEAGLVRRLAERLAQAARLAVIDVGQSGADNAAVVQLRTGRSCATLARPVEFEVVVHNFGRVSRKAQAIELAVDGRRAARRTIDLPAGQSQLVRFSHRFESRGEHVIEARLAPDRLAIDDHRWLVVPVRSAVEALCVDGAPGGEEFGGATTYLAAALAPAGGPSADAPVRPTVVTEGALMEHDLARYDCVFLCNVGQVTSSESRGLADYVRAGGGLVVFLGDRVLTGRYNRELFDDLHLLPAALGGVIEDAQPGFDPLDYAHPIVALFRGQERTGLLTTPVDKYVKLVVPPRSAARIVLATRSGDPLIVEQGFGHGRVVLVATSADTSWTPMPLWPSYVPLVQEILAYTAAGRAAGHTVLVGQTLCAPLGDPSSSDIGRIIFPDGREHALATRVEGGRHPWSFDGTDSSGVYTVRFGATESRFAVNVDTIESDLEKLSERQFREAVWSGVVFDYETAWRETERAAAEPVARRGSLARWLLVGGFVLLVAETLLAREFGHYGAANGSASETTDGRR